MEHASAHQGKSIHTDGAKTHDRVVCAVAIGEMIIKKRLPAEIYAVLQALKYIFNVELVNEKFTVFYKFNYVLFSLKKLVPRHQLVQELQDLLDLLHS